MPNSRFALHGFSPSLIHGLCAFFASNSRFVRLSQAALDTPFFSASQFTVCTSRFARPRHVVDAEFPYRVPIVDRGTIAAPLFAATVSDS